MAACGPKTQVIQEKTYFGFYDLLFKCYRPSGYNSATIGPIGIQI